MGDWCLDAPIRLSFHKTEKKLKDQLQIIETGESHMKKQIILIMTDTTRTDMLGCYGNPKLITPNLDRLSAEGIRYENAYTCQPVCGPAMGSPAR